MSYTQEEFLNILPASLIHPDAITNYKEMRAEILNTPGTSFFFHHQLQHKNGSWVWCEGTTTNLLDEEGINAMVCNFSDITDRKKTELELKSSEAFSKGVLSALVSHIAVLDSDGKIVSTNDAWKEFSSNNGENDLINTSEGGNYYTVCEKSASKGDTLAGGVLAGLKNVINDKSPEFYIEYPCHSPLEERWFSMQALKFENEDEPMVVISHQNITARKLAEFELVVNNAELTKTNSELDRFVYSISHELRMPLTSIMSLQKLVKKDALDERSKGILELIRKSANTMDEVLREILDYSRNTRVETKIDSIDLAAMVDSAFDNLNFYQEGFSFDKRIVLKADSVFYSDLARVKIVVNNLVSNALKYSNKTIEDAFIEINIVVDETKMTMEISDNGIGINAEYLPNIFKMFYRATTEFTGSGLGLYIVKECIEKLGGTISAASKLGNGTKFSIEIPNHNLTDSIQQF